MALAKALVMGGVDGTITSFAVIAGAHFTDDAVHTATVVGLSSVVADGLSMAVSEFVSSEAEAELRARPGAPILLAGACLLAFVACGSVPIVLFVLTGRLLSVAFFALAQLMLLGVARSLATGTTPLRPLVTTAGLGAIAGGVAFGVAGLASE